MAPEQPKQRVEVTREELHELVWPASMSKLAERFGVSGNGLKKICDRLEVPYPSLGHWAKKAAGHDVPTKPLPKPGPDVPASVTITPTPAPPAAPAIAPEAQATIDALKAEIGPEATEQTLLKPHAIIAAWRKELDKDRRAAKRGAWNDPGESTEMHERQFRILDVILKALAARKIRITKERGNQLVVELGEEKIEFGLRERQRKTATRRPSEERHHAFPGDFTFRDDMEGTGRLVDRHLQQLLAEGRLEKVSGGLYMAPRETRFGKAPASDAELVAGFLGDDRFLLVSPNAYNGLGVGTTQLYNAPAVYNHKRHGLMHLDGRPFEFRRRMSFPKVVSEEFLLVDLLHNLTNLAEDAETVRARALQRATTMDRAKLEKAVREYDSARVRRQLEPLFAEDEFALAA